MVFRLVFRPSTTIAPSLSSAFYSLLPFAMIAVVWELSAAALGPTRCPGMGLTFSRLIESFLYEPIIEAQGGGSNGFAPHLGATLAGFSSGFVGGSSFGFLAALIMVQFRKLLLLVEPALEFLRALPPLLVVPFAVVLCRSNDVLEAVTISAYSMFSVCVYTLNSLGNLPPSYTQLASLLGARQPRLTMDVQIPAVMPELVGGLRVTAALSLGIAVVVEYLAVPQGLGRVMKYAISYSRIDLIVVATIWVILLALIFDTILSVVFRIVLRWTRR